MRLKRYFQAISPKSSLKAQVFHRSFQIFLHSGRSGPWSTAHYINFAGFYQADLLKDQGEGLEHHRATDLILHATKQMAWVIGHSMAVMVAMERRLSSNILGIKEGEKSFPLKGIVHFEIIFFICFSLSQGHPRCRYLCFQSRKVFPAGSPESPSATHLKRRTEVRAGS